MTVRACALAFLLLAAACGGESRAESPSGISPGAAPTSFAAPERSPRDLAAAFGCVDFIDTHAAQLYTYASGTCTYQGQVAQVVTFRDNAGRDQWLAIGQQFGGSFVVGDRFAVTARGIDLAKAASDLQGELR